MKKTVKTDQAPAPVGPYSQAIRANGMLFVSGQVPLAPASEGGDGTLGGTIEEQAKRVLENLKAILAAAGSSLGKVVKTTIFLADLNNFAAVNRIYGEYFPEDHDPPARSTVEVSRLPLGAEIEIELIALE